MFARTEAAEDVKCLKRDGDGVGTFSDNKINYSIPLGLKLFP